MGFLRNPGAFLSVLQVVTEMSNFRFILFTAGHEQMEEAILAVTAEESSCSGRDLHEDGITLSNGRIFCFSGLVLSDLQSRGRNSRILNIQLPLTEKKIECPNMHCVMLSNLFFFFRVWPFNFILTN